MNDGSRRVWRASLASGGLIYAALAALMAPSCAVAQVAVKVTATGQFESNSNVFALQSGVVQPQLPQFRRADTYYAYGAGFDAQYSFGRQQLYANGATTEYQYQHFTELDRNDYYIDGGLLWKLGGAWDGKLDVSRRHSMVPFLNLSGSVLALTIATEQRETAQFGYRVLPDWRIEELASYGQTNQPIPQEPYLQLKQTQSTTQLQYLGWGALTSGFTADYLSGRYSGANDALNPSFTQETAGLLAKYRHNRITFEGNIAYARRNSDNAIDDTSAITALFDLQDQLTPKTSVTVRIDRTINSYLPNLGSEVDTIAGVSVSWKATYKLAMTLGYVFTYRDYPHQSNYPPGENRIDWQEDATIGIEYRPWRWLLIRPYANIQTRQSNVQSGNFNSRIIGIAFTASSPDTLKKPQ